MERDSIVEKINEYILSICMNTDREINLLPLHPSEYDLLVEELGEMRDDGEYKKQTLIRPQFFSLQLATPIGYVNITKSIHAKLLLQSPKYSNFLEKLQEIE